MDAWNLILLLSVTAIWLGMVSAVAWMVTAQERSS
jgi:hypothetical protein